MAIYKKTNPQYLRKSIDSMLNQTIPTNDFVIVADGELTAKLEDIISEYIGINEGIFNIIRLKENSGLGIALKTGVLQCKNRLIARMDDDDISYLTRCETQLREFEQDRDLDLIGGYIDEFDDDDSNIIDRREVPISQKEMLRYSRRRSPINHCTVMFDKDAVIKNNNYSDYRLCQDIELWARMLNGNCKMRNLPISLVKGRFDENTYLRRKNRNNISTMISIWNNFFIEGYCTQYDYLLIKYTQTVIGILPLPIIKFLYKLSRKRRTG